MPPSRARAWAAPALFLASRVRPTSGYDAEHRIEAARLYGDVGGYAYYFVDLLIGTPTPQRASVIVDTGSTVCAFPCSGCEHCGSHLDAAFDVSRSKTHRWISCSNGNHCGRCFEGRCSYMQSYTEGSSISGSWFHDYISLGDEFQRNPPVMARLGCHSRETNLFYTQRANGIFGMAPSDSGKPSILEDLFRDRAHVDTAVFAMCLAQHGGLLTVGGYNQSLHLPDASGAVPGPLWLPMVIRGYYSIVLSKIGLADGTFYLNNGFGHTIVDSGTTYTYLPQGLYRRLRDAVNGYCDKHRKGGNPCGVKSAGDTCWIVEQYEQLSLFPTLRVHFAEGGQMDWYPQSYMYQQNGKGSSWCYGFQDNGAVQETVLGATWMLHRNVIFDLANKRLGIAQANCPSFRQRPPPPSGTWDVPPAAGEDPTSVGATAWASPDAWPALAVGAAGTRLSTALLLVLAVAGVMLIVRNLRVAAARAQRLTDAATSAAAAKAVRRSRRGTTPASTGGGGQTPGAGARSMEEASPSPGGSLRAGSSGECVSMPLPQWLRSQGNSDGELSGAASQGSSPGGSVRSSDAEVPSVGFASLGPGLGSNVAGRRASPG